MRSLSASEAVASQSELSARPEPGDPAVQLALRRICTPDEALAGLDVTTTDACIVATALLRSQSLLHPSSSPSGSPAAGGERRVPVDPRVKTLAPMHDHFTPEREMLAHARRQADELGLDDYFVVDVDSHRDPGSVWPAILRHMENPVMRSNSQHDLDVMGVTQYVPTPGGRGFQFQAMHGRIRPGADAGEPGADRRPARRRAVPSRDGRDEHRRAGGVPHLSCCHWGCHPCLWVSHRWRTPTTSGWSRSSAARTHGSSSSRSFRSTTRTCACG